MIDKNKLRSAVMDDKVTFFVLPKSSLIEMIVRGENSIVNSLPADLKTVFLSKKGLAIENAMVEKYINNTIDEKHKLILDNCEIRVFQKTVEISGKK
jgi:hypothetical protein